MRTELDNTTIIKQRKVLESALFTNPALEKEVRKLISKVLEDVRKEMRQAAKGSLSNDPRKAYLAVRKAVWKRVLGGNVNILSPRRAGNSVEWEPQRKLDQNPHQRGGNRRRRNSRTEKIDNYYGVDRGFILRFVNSGTAERTTRYGRRGAIAPRNWFGGNVVSHMKTAAWNLAAEIDKVIQNKFNNG